MLGEGPLKVCNKGMSKLRDAGEESVLAQKGALYQPIT